MPIPESARERCSLMIHPGNAGFHLTRASELRPDDAVVQNNLADVILDRGQPAQAIATQNEGDKEVRALVVELKDVRAKSRRAPGKTALRVKPVSGKKPQ